MKKSTENFPMIVTFEDEDKRLDRWLKAKLGPIPQSRIELLCRKGVLLVNGEKVKTSFRVMSGDTIEVPIGLSSSNEKTESYKFEALSKAEENIIRDTLIYEDEYLLAINKPSGIATQGGTGQKVHIDKLVSFFSSDYHTKPKLVHRLDRETSGVLVLAKSSKLAAELANCFRDRSVKKIYWALAAGIPNDKEGSIEFPLVKIKNNLKTDDFERVQCVTDDRVHSIDNAKKAKSNYVIIEALGTRACWLGLSPITGRTHQLRAHLAQINCPIIGDMKYGKNSQVNKGDGWGSLLGEQIENKLHLHSRSIMFTHPITKKQIFIEADMPSHMMTSWKVLGLDAKYAVADPFLKND